MKTYGTRSLVSCILLLVCRPALSQDVTDLQKGRFDAEAVVVAQPYTGVSTDGSVATGLFDLAVSPAPSPQVSDAALAVLDALSDDQRSALSFSVDDVQWRRWSNMPHTIYYRRGISLKDLAPHQRELVFELVRTSVSKKGWRQINDIMRVDIYEEGSFWLTILGTPSATGPWGWQLQGHHLAINFFMVGNQVVMTPVFMGAEPAVVTSGDNAGIAILQAEQDRALALMDSLSDDQKELAIFSDSMTGIGIFADALNDNLVLDYTGLSAAMMNDAQRSALLQLIGEFTGNMRDEDARDKMQEVRRHLDETHFAWAGRIDEEAVFYYRIHSPVVLIEFAHVLPFALPDVDKTVPTRQHIHSIIRTPNGNDYGKELLRQYRTRHGDSRLD